MKVTKGFFWLPEVAIKIITPQLIIGNVDEEARIVVEFGERAEISHCVFFKRPKWYQFKQWYRAFKYWIHL